MAFAEGSSSEWDGIPHMTSGHFLLVARVIKELCDDLEPQYPDHPALRHSMALRFARELVKSNNAERFLLACGLNETMAKSFSRAVYL